MPGLPSTGSISISQIQAEVDDMVVTLHNSLNNISNHVGFSTPHSMSEFRGYAYDAFNHASGATNIGGYSGKASFVPITFSQSTFGSGNESVSIWTLANFQDGERVNFQQNQDNPGTTINSLKVYQGTGFFGPWTLIGQGAPQFGIGAIIYASNGTYLRLVIDKQDGSENTLYTANFKVWET